MNFQNSFFVHKTKKNLNISNQEKHKNIYKKTQLQLS